MLAENMELACAMVVVVTAQATDVWRSWRYGRSVRTFLFWSAAINRKPLLAVFRPVPILVALSSQDGYFRI